MLVKAKQPFAVDLDGTPVVVTDDHIFEDTDPLVRARPDLFTPVVATRTVEQATAAPGERRTTRRGG